MFGGDKRCVLVELLYECLCWFVGGVEFWVCVSIGIDFVAEYGDDQVGVLGEVLI